MQFRNDTTSTDHDKSIFPRMRQNPLHGCSESARLGTESERVGSFYMLIFSCKGKLEDSHKKGKCRFFFFWGSEAKLAFGEWHQSIKFRVNEISGTSEMDNVAFKNW